MEPDNHRTGVSQWGYLVETNFCFDKYAYLFPASHDIWADKLAKMEDSYLTQHWLFTFLEREILSQFGCINESYQFVLQPNYIIVANINSVFTGKGLALSNPCSLIWPIFCFLSVRFYQWSWKRNTPIQFWTKTWPLPIFLGEVGDRFAASCSRVCPAWCLPEGGKRPTGLSVATWSLAWPVGRWCSGSGAVAIDKVVQVHPGLEDLLLVGKIGPQIEGKNWWSK